MKYIKFCTIKNKKGFTLIEVIVSLVVAAILGAMLAAFMGTGMMKSANPVILAQNGAYLNSIIENMGADYKKIMATAAQSNSSRGSALTSFISNVGAEGSSQNYYSIDTSRSYTVVNNHRISFTSASPSTETTDTSGKILKVTINYNNLTATANYNNLTATALFTE